VRAVALVVLLVLGTPGVWPAAVFIADGAAFLDGLAGDEYPTIVTGRVSPEGAFERFAGYVIAQRASGTIWTPITALSDPKTHKIVPGTGKIIGKRTVVPNSQAGSPHRPLTPSIAAAVPDDASGQALNVSRDGRTVVGFYDSGYFTFAHAFRWTEASDVVDLGTLDPANNASRSSVATDVSSDGSVIVGFSDFTSTFIQRAFRWTQVGGMVDLGSAAGATGSSRAFGVSGDGNVVVGETGVPNNFGGTTPQAFRWTSAGGFQRLGAVEADFPSVAIAVSADGAVVVGMSGVTVRVGNTVTTGSRAFRWTQNGGMQNLGVLPGHQYAAATGVSDDGTIVVGVSSSGIIDRSGPGGAIRSSNSAADSRAFYWTAQTGMQDLNQLLTSAGAGLAGGTLVAATGISTNGQWITGVAVRPGPTQSLITGAFASLTAAPLASSRLANLSTRAICQTGDNVLIPGFVVSGTGNKRLLIRAVGPKLSAFGVSGVLPDPQIVVKRLVNGAYVDLASNDNWGSNANAAAIVATSAALGAFPLDAGSLDSVLLLDVPAGQYTAVASGVGNTTGIGIVELYDGDASTSGARLTNIANRGFVGTGDDIMVMGYVISEGASKRLLIRAVGPTLGTFGVSGPLADPRLVVFRREASGANTTIATNDDWGLDANAAATAAVAAQVSAFALPANSRDQRSCSRCRPDRTPSRAAAPRMAPGSRCWRFMRRHERPVLVECASGFSP